MVEYSDNMAYPYYARDPDLGARQPQGCTGCERMTAGREYVSPTERLPLCEKCAKQKGY